MAETKYYADITDWEKTISTIIGAYLLILLILFALHGITCDPVCQDSISVSWVGYLITPIILIVGFWLMGIFVGINIFAFKKRIYFQPETNPKKGN